MPRARRLELAPLDPTSHAVVDFHDPRQRAAAADAIAGRLHMSFGVCRDRAQVIARELLDASQAAALAARSQET